MKAQSDSIPERFVKSRGRVQFNYNIHEITVANLDGTTRTAYEYDYVELEGDVTRSKLIDAVISDKFTKADEIALINDKLANINVDKYRAYQTFRAQVKGMVDEALKRADVA